VNVHSTSLCQSPEVKHRAWRGVCSCGWVGLTWNYMGSARNEAAKHEREANRVSS
jgi:hypothetical protein